MVVAGPAHVAVRARAAAGGFWRRDRAAAQERRDEAVRDDVGGERGLGGRLQQGGAVDLSELDDALGGADRLIDGKAPGTTCKLNDSQRQAVAEMVETGPTPAIHGVVRWRLKELTLWVWEEFRISLSETTLSRELRALGYRKLSARPRHDAQNPEALELFKKVSPPPWRRSGRASQTALL